MFQQGMMGGQDPQAVINNVSQVCFVSESKTSCQN